MSGNDSRFDKVFSDPRFMVAPKKVSKVKIDSRFKTMFKEKDFNVVAKVDKYGKRIDKKDNHALQNYYTKDKSDEESGPSDDNEDANPGKKFYDSDGNFNWKGESSSGSDEDEEKSAEPVPKKKNLSDESSDGEQENYDSASYSDDVSGVWSLHSNNEDAQDAAV